MEGTQRKMNVQVPIRVTTTQIILHASNTPPYSDDGHGLVVTVKDEGVGEFISIKNVDGSGEVTLDFDMITSLYEALELFDTEYEARKGGGDE